MTALRIARSDITRVAKALCAFNGIHINHWKYYKGQAEFAIRAYLTLKAKGKRK